MAAGLRKTLAALEDPSGGRLVYSYFKCLKISKYEKGNEKLEAPGRDRLWRERGREARDGRRRGSGGDAAGRGAGAVCCAMGSADRKCQVCSQRVFTYEMPPRH